jgi:hypothetical protein
LTAIEVSRREPDRSQIEERSNQFCPAAPRVVETGFNDATGARVHSIVVNGGYRERDCIGPHVPVQSGGGGEHELPGPLDTTRDVIERAVFITSARGQPS